jgi:hypothetical protein
MNYEEGLVAEILDGMRRDGSLIYTVLWQNGIVSTATSEWVMGNAPDKLMEFLEGILGYDQ